MRLLRHPFGIDEDHLRRLMARRDRDHGRALAGLRTRLERLRAANAERRQYLSLLREELAELQAKEETLTRILNGEAPDQETADPGAALEALAEQLVRTRALSRQIAADVFALIRPYLHGSTEQKGEQHVQGCAPQSLQTTPHFGGARHPGDRF